jgi:hypothetical protein
LLDRSRRVDPCRLGEWSDEPIAPPGERLDKSRHIGRIPERITQPANGSIQAVLEINERVRRPQSLSQFFAGNEPSRTIEKRPEKLKWLFGEVDPDASLPKLARTQIQLECAKANGRIWGRAHGRGLAS